MGTTESMLLVALVLTYLIAGVAIALLDHEADDPPLRTAIVILFWLYMFLIYRVVNIAEWWRNRS